MKTADWIQLAAAVISLGATLAAWWAAASARDSAKQTRAGQLIEFHARRLAALQGLYGFIARREQSSDWDGLTGELDAIGLPLPKSRDIDNKWVVHGQAPTPSMLQAAKSELGQAMTGQNDAIVKLERELSGRPLPRWLGCALPGLTCANAATTSEVLYRYPRLRLSMRRIISASTAV